MALKSHILSTKQENTSSKLLSLSTENKELESSLNSFINITGKYNLQQSFKTCEFQVAKSVQSYFTKWHEATIYHRHYLKTKFFIRILRLYQYDIKRSYIKKWYRTAVQLRVNQKAKNFVSNVDMNKKVISKRMQISHTIENLKCDKFYKGLTKICNIKSKLDLKLIKKRFKLWDCAVKVLYKVKT